jgi:F0F1-type ATP synthase epsilon subunit
MTEGNKRFRIALSQMENFEQRAKPPATREERDLKKAKDRLNAEQAMVDRRRADAAFRANFQRLKTERLSRESK